MPSPAEIAAVVSDISRPTSLLENWNANATERMLAGSGATPMSANAIWLRKISLVVYGSSSSAGGQQSGIELSMMRCTFNLQKYSKTSPNFLYAKVYNLHPNTQKKVKQYSRVQLAAGYQGSQYGMIFDGTVVMYIDGKENPVDTYIEIFAGDADAQVNTGVQVLTWPPDTLPSQKAKDDIKAMGLPVGEVSFIGEQPSLRSSTYVGMARDHIRDLTNAYPSDFYVDDGTAHIIPWSGYRSGEAVNLSPTTGLVGIPKVTPQGIEVQCLLNPKLRLGGQVHIDSKLLSGVPYTPGTNTPYSGLPTTFTATGEAFNFGAASVNTDTGNYKILLLNHTGDTRGNPWYSNIVCSAIGAKWPGLAFDRSVTSVTAATSAAAPSVPSGQIIQLDRARLLRGY